MCQSIYDLPAHAGLEPGPGPDQDQDKDHDTDRDAYQETDHASVHRSVSLLACRSVDPVGRSVWLSFGVVGQSVGLSVNRNWSARQLVSLSLEALGLHCVALGVPLASFVRSWARLWDVLGSFLGALGLHFDALECLWLHFYGLGLDFGVTWA